MDTEVRRRLRVCLVGATGRMGRLIIREADAGFEFTGAVAAEDDPDQGKTLAELGVGSGNSKTSVTTSEHLPSLLKNSDVCISFTSARAEMSNLRYLQDAPVPAVIGTTGFSPPDREKLNAAFTGRVAAVIASNFSVGANLLTRMALSLAALPQGFDVSIVEAHHSGKADAPSGTALALADAVSEARGYTKVVNGRSGASTKRRPDELEILSLRGGGTPGEHAVLAFGPNETIKLEHVVFSRSAFALGALHAARWVAQKREPRVYNMLDVLGLRGP